ncbi:MAG: hypothetical protein AB1414_17070 [bacterium]
MSKSEGNIKNAQKTNSYQLIKWICIFCAVSTFPAVSNSELKLTLTPPIIELSTVQGAVKTFPLLVTNNGESDLQIKLYATDLVIERGGKVLFLKPGISKYSCTQWLTLLPKEKVLRGNETIQVMCKLSVPKGELGGRYSAIMVEIVPEKIEKSTPIYYRLASLLLVTIKGYGLTTNAVIEDIQLNPSKNYSGYEIIASLKNTGNIHIVANGEAVLKNEQGYRLRGEPITLTAGKGTVLPEAIRDFKGDFRSNIRDGIYIIETKFVYAGKREKTKSKKIKVSKGKIEELKEEELIAVSKEAQKKEKLWVEPSFIDLISPPGGMRSFSILVRNEGQSELEVEVFAQDYAVNEEGQISYLPAGNQPYSCAKWIAINQSKFNLSPKDKRNLSFSIRVPREVNGGKYAKLCFAGLTKDKKATVTSEVSISVEIPNTAVKKAEIENISYQKNKDNSLSFFVTFVNLGNIHLRPKGNLRIYEEEKRKEIVNIPLMEEIEPILPNQKRIISSLYKGELKRGNYYAVVELDFGDKEPISKKQKLTVK